jgi:hypothetical protein
MILSQQAASYRFWEVVVQWSRERLENEQVVARALARAVLQDGLRLHSVDPAETTPMTLQLRGAPLVGYVAREGRPPIVIRLTALRHLEAIVGQAAAADPASLSQEFFRKPDLIVWLQRRRIEPPHFWFAPQEPIASPS